MPQWLPSIRYPPEQEGYWAPITSTLDWCEENYYATFYAAEITNTLTNLAFILLAFKGMTNCVRNGHDRVFFLGFLSYLLVGSGSFAFHATLKYPMQLVDELSMIYGTCIMCWATFSHERSQTFQIVFGILNAGLALFITLYYHYLQDPTFHQTTYALLTAIVLFRAIFVMETRIRPSRRPSNRRLSIEDEAEERRRDARDRQIVKTMWTMIAVGLTSFLGGFGIWILDNTFCSTLRRWRHDVGLPWGLVLEGHAWWHVLTGLGAYFYLVWGIWLRHCLNGEQDEVELVWPRMLGSIPSVERRRKAVNGFAPGSGKKQR